MNYRKVYKSHIQSVFEDECHSIIRTVMYVKTHYYAMPVEFKDADHVLNDQDKNNIIWSILGDANDN